MACQDFNEFKKQILKFDQAVIIDQETDKPLRYNVWETTSGIVKNLIESKDIDSLPKKSQSMRIARKIENGLKRIRESAKTGGTIQADIFNKDNNIEMSIALHELMESVKGESDKARNEGIEITDITDTGILPTLPLSRVAASIGRKIAFQKGYRFKRGVDDKSAASIELLYYDLGKTAIEELKENGYVNIHSDLGTIQDYINRSDLKKEFTPQGKVIKNVLSVTLNEKTLGIEAGSQEAAYFLNRTAADLDNTDLGVVTDMLRVVSQITQPATIVLPDIKKNKSEAELAENDEGIDKIDGITEKVRKDIYDTPTFVHESLHGLMQLLHEAGNKNGESASQIINKMFRGNPNLTRDLFGLKRSDDFSIDRKESVAGQNLSKTTPLDDIAEYYDLLINEDGSPSALHMAMKLGRNARLYYENSVLNPHASKQSRYMLTPGRYEVDVNSDDYKFLAHGIFEALGDRSLTYQNITEGNQKLDGALKLLNEYENSNDLGVKLAKISHMSKAFPGVDYVTLVTSLKAINDIQNPKNGKVSTEFTVAVDATASGGTITFLQALGTNVAIEAFLERTGALKDDNGNAISPNAENKLDDLYGLMTEAIEDFLAGKTDTNTVASDDDSGAVKLLLQDTLDTLFDDGNDVRELSKDPTMVFVYGQGKPGAIKTMSRSLANRIIDNLDDPKNRQYLSRLTGKPEHRNLKASELRDTQGLYNEITQALVTKGLPAQLFSLMEIAINKEFLADYKQRSVDVFAFAKKLPADQPLKVLPASAVMDNKVASQGDDLETYGMPLSKEFEVSNEVPDQPDTVLTRKEKLQKPVMDVSPVHSVDAAQAYLTLDETMQDSGVIVTHDEIRGNVSTVRDSAQEYVNKSKEILGKYDIHQQIMEAIAFRSPEIASTPAFQTLKADIDADVANKQRILEARFNNETDSLIGDGARFLEFANAETDPQPDFREKTSPPPGAEAAATPQTSDRGEVLSTKTTQETSDINFKAASAADVLSELSKDSEIITNFVNNTATNAQAIKGVKNEFDAANDVVVISDMDNGGKKLDINSKAGREKMVEMVEHEIVHNNTVGFIHEAVKNKTASNELKFVAKAMDRIYQQGLITGEGIAFSEATKRRLEYALGPEGDTTRNIAEFVAIMETESAVAQEVVTFLGKGQGNALQNAIAKIIKLVKRAAAKITQSDLDAPLVNPELLIDSINSISQTGVSIRLEQNDQFVEYQRDYAKTLGVGPDIKNPDADRKDTMDYLNYAVATMLNSRLERKGKRIAGNVHSIMYKKFPMYMDVADKLRKVYDGSPELQQLLHTITGEGADKTAKADILAKNAEVIAQRTGILNDQVANLDELSKDLPKKQKAFFNQLMTDMPLHDYFLLADEVKTAEDVDSTVELLEKDLKKINPRVIKDVNSLIDWNIGVLKDGKRVQKITGDIYNLEAGKYSLEGAFGRKVRKLLAVKSIQALGAKEFETLLENKDLVDAVKDNSVANRLSLLTNQGTENLRDSLVPDYYKEPVIKQAISLKELKGFELGEHTGWEILRTPEKGKLGIVFKKIIDSEEIAGAFTDTKLQTTDIEVFGEQIKDAGVVSTVNGHKLLLTKEERTTLGENTGFGQALVRGTAHSVAIQESQIIRDTLLETQVMDVGESKSSQKEVIDIIKSDNVDNPWFLKMDEGINYSNLDKDIRAKYMLVGSRASNVKGFNDNVDLVRKDIAHWLIGGSSKALFENPQLKWAHRILKNLVSGAKIGMVVLNPVKIANDNLSNITYLSVIGVPPKFVAENYAAIGKDFAEYSDLERQIIRMKVQLVARPESTKLKKQVGALQKRLANNPLGDLTQKGFVNSLGSDLVSRNADTLSGFQADMHTALEYLLKKDGKKNFVSHFITRLGQIGFQGEDFLSYIAGIAGRFDSTKLIQQELDQVADRIKEIKSEDDIVNYVAQYTTSPGSEAVRVGSSTTDLTDVLAKETLWRHFTENKGMSAADARIKVLDSFPDYKENMPLAIKQLSDNGIIMFPSFWLRIQKIIYRMARDKPINLATELMIQEAVGSNINTIFEANIINKSNTFGGLLHMPFEPVGAGSVIPLHIFS